MFPSSGNEVLRRIAPHRQPPSPPRSAWRERAIYLAERSTSCRPERNRHRGPCRTTHARSAHEIPSPWLLFRPLPARLVRFQWEAKERGIEGSPARHECRLALDSYLHLVTTSAL